MALRGLAWDGVEDRLGPCLHLQPLFTHPIPLQCGVPGPAGPLGPHAQPPAVAATINAPVPAPAPPPPRARTSVSGCTRRRRCVPHRPAQVLSASGRDWGAKRSLPIPPKGVCVVNLIPTHTPQKAGRRGLSGVHARRMESKAVAGTVRSWSPGPALVPETAARAAPAPTGRFPVGLRASAFTPTLPALSPQLPYPSEVSWGCRMKCQGGRFAHFGPLPFLI